MDVGRVSWLTNGPMVLPRDPRRERNWVQGAPSFPRNLADRPTQLGVGTLYKLPTGQLDLTFFRYHDNTSTFYSHVATRL
jgi:hypothetical protein